MYLKHWLLVDLDCLLLDYLFTIWQFSNLYRLLLQSTKRQLSKRLQNLDWKLQEQIETSKLIANDVHHLFELSASFEVTKT